ncbi:MAG: transglycosylase SLT domain-containing protein [Myxococcota bacterium]
MRLLSVGAGLAWFVCVVAVAASDLESVAALVRTGQDQEALVGIRSLSESQRDDSAVRYLEGRLLLEVGRPCDAQKALSESTPSLPEDIRVDSRRRWAIAAARCGDCADARPVLLGTDSGDAAVTRHDRVIAADCAIQLGEFEQAATELERLTRRRREGTDQVALLVMLGDVYARLGRTEDAEEVARRAWILAVAPQQRDVAARMVERFEPTDEDRLDRAQSFVDARRFGKAVELLETVPPNDALDERRLHMLGMALFRMRTRYDEAARVLRASAERRGKYATEDAFHAARALSRADQDARAVRAYRAFAKRYPRSRRAPEARFLAAWLEIRMGRKNGEVQMARLLQGKNQVRGKWRRSALWELGFRSFEKRRYARAARYLEQYTRLATSAMDEARGLYWLGRAYRRGPKAVEAYREAIDVEPLHWYAVLAAARLERLGVTPPDPFESRDEGGAASDETVALALPETFVVYRGLGLDRDGIRWLADHEKGLVDDYPKPDRIRLLATLYDEIGAYRDGLRVARKKMAFLHTDPAENRWWWNAAYPMPWQDIVDAHRGDLPRALIYATMRQESGYNPVVVSRAGAVGLMQLMPEVASKLAGTPTTRRLLEQPSQNIPLGIEEMAALASDFDGVFPLSIAAYNAGKQRVRRWLRESRRMELDRFVERIPFNETRNYVRRVTTHYARYVYLQDASAGWPTLPPFVAPGVGSGR